MSDAVFEGREVVIWAFAVCGGLDITVPDSVEIRNEGVGIMGGFAARGGTNPDPNAPVVVLKGLALMGGVGGQTTSRRHRKRDRHRDREQDRDRDQDRRDRGHGELH
jgi:hypothetical protein